MYCAIYVSDSVSLKRQCLNFILVTFKMFVSSLLLIAAVQVGYVSGGWHHECDVDVPITPIIPVRRGTIRLPRGSEIMPLNEFADRVCFITRNIILFFKPCSCAQFAPGCKFAPGSKSTPGCKFAPP